MDALTPVRAAGIATLLGFLSHVTLFIRLDLDAVSHRLLVLANLAVILTPIILYLRGHTVGDALYLSVILEFCYAASLLSSIGIYRTCLHPIRHYPGPFWARVSVFWKVKQFQQSKSRAFSVIDDAHRKYGNVVRLAPRQLSINEPAAYATIYGFNSPCRRLKHLELLRPNLQSLSDPAEHGARRKVWDHGLSAKACQSYIPRINEITGQLCKQLTNFDSRPTVINAWCHRYTFDVMGDIGFGRSYGQLETGTTHPAITKVEDFLKAGVIALQIIWVVNFLAMIPGLKDPMQDLGDWADQLLDERARRNANEKTDSNKDLMSYVEESRKVVETRWPMTEKDLREDAVTLQIAGSDTSYSVLVNMCHYLANYPELQAKVRAEVLETFPKDGEAAPLWSKLASPQACPYLHATIEEVMRRHTPVPMGTLRETPNYPMDIAGHTVPPKTVVSCPIWTMHYDERSFPRGNEFIPQRWLDKSHPEAQPDLLLDKRGFVPFSAGPMNCAGKYFAYMEVKLCFAHILRQFDVVFPGQKQNGKGDNGQARRERDKRQVAGTKDYLTQWAAETEVCFLPLPQ